MPKPGLIVCFSVAAARFISLHTIGFWSVPSLKGRGHKAWGSSTAHQRDDGAQVLTTITAKGVLPLEISTEGFEMYASGQKALLVELE